MTILVDCHNVEFSAITLQRVCLPVHLGRRRDDGCGRLVALVTAQVEYHVEVDPMTLQLDVSVEMSGDFVREGMTACVPHWVAGDYSFKTYARDVFELSVSDPRSGAGVAVRRRGLADYQLSPHRSAVTLRYRAFCCEPDLGDAMGLVDCDDAILLGTRYLYPPEHLGACSVDSRALPRGWRIHHPAGAQRMATRALDSRTIPPTACSRRTTTCGSYGSGESSDPQWTSDATRRHRAICNRSSAGGRRRRRWCACCCSSWPRCTTEILMRRARSQTPWKGCSWTGGSTHSALAIMRGPPTMTSVTTQILRAPGEITGIAARRVYLVGSAFSNDQAWVESAFCTAESVLVDKLGLEPIIHTKDYPLICGACG